MKYWIRVLLTPSCWIQNKPYSAKWNALLNKLLMEEEFTDVTEFYARIGGIQVWINNHPYASFSPYHGNFELNIRPRRSTILKAYDKLATIDPVDYLENDYIASKMGNLK